MKIRSRESIEFGKMFNVIGTDKFSCELSSSTFHPKDLTDVCTIINTYVNEHSVRIYVHYDYADVINEITELGECSSFTREDTGEEIFEYPRMVRRYYRK